MKSILGVSLVVLCSACASQPAPDPIRYAIITPTEVVAHEAPEDIDRLLALRAASANDLLWFERNGVEYIVSDPATVAKAAKESNDLERQFASLARTMRVPQSTIVRVSLSAPSASWGYAAPAPAATSEDYAREWQAESREQAEDQLNRATAAAQADERRRHQADYIARAGQRLQRTVDDAISNGLARPVS
jgi:hypothetical protein